MWAHLFHYECASSHRPCFDSLIAAVISTTCKLKPICWSFRLARSGKSTRLILSLVERQMICMIFKASIKLSESSPPEKQDNCIGPIFTARITNSVWWSIDKRDQSFGALRIVEIFFSKFSYQSIFLDPDSVTDCRTEQQ